MSDEQIDKTLRMAYVQITASGEPTIETRKSQDRDNYSQVNSGHEEINSSIYSGNNSKLTGGVNQAQTQRNAKIYGQVKELKLLKLNYLIDMVKNQAELEDSHDMILKMDAVLAKFDQAVKYEVKKRDYRSAFTDLQRRLHDERAMTYQEQAMKKYKPENPWDRWRPQMSV